MAVEWTDDLRSKVISDYKAKEPTPETSTEIVAEIAKNIDATPNGVRAILIKANEYVKKSPAKAAETSTGSRVNKAQAAATLTKLIEDNQLTADSDIISKMTGKAATYFTTLITELTKTEE